MKSIKKYFLIGALTLLLLFSWLLAGCQSNRAGENGTSGDLIESETVSSPAECEFLELIRNKAPARVVVAFNASETLNGVAENIAKLLGNISGTTVKVTKDSVAYDAAAVEILIGKTAYPESANQGDGLAYGDWQISVVGNKVVIYAFSESYYSAAATELMSLIYSQKGQDRVLIASDYHQTGTGNESLNRIPKLNGQTPSAVYSTGTGIPCSGVVFTNVAEDAYESYQSIVSAEGYTKYAENKINTNRFSTYTNSEYSVNVMYTPALKRITVTSERLSNTDLPTRESENVYSKETVYDTTVTQLGMRIGLKPDDAWSAYINGLGHVIRLEDGSFIIIDGGHPREINADQLYRTLKKQAPDPDHIVVAAWIFTHAHDDHVGAFTMFDHKEVTVEQFIFSFPTSSEGSKGGGGLMAATTNKMRSSYPNAKTVNAHPGQAFYIRNAKIEMLWTLDLFYPNEFTFFNESSLVFTVELEGHKILYLGDMGPRSNPVIMQIYGNALQTDIVQTAHHGFEGGSVAFYALVQPKYVFWDTGLTGFISDKHGNDYFSYNDSIVKWNGEDNVIVVTLQKGQSPSSKFYETADDYFKS